MTDGALVSRTADAEPELPVLDGVTLQEAFDQFLDVRFANLELLEIGNGARVLTADACDVYRLIDKRFGAIERDERLICCGEDFDVANKLVAAGVLTLEEARADVLVYRQFWDLFRFGEWIARGRHGGLAADDLPFDSRAWNFVTSVNLPQSKLFESNSGARFVDVRVYSAHLQQMVAEGPAAHTGKNKGGAPPKSNFFEHMDELVLFDLKNLGRTTKKDLAERLAEIDFEAKHQRPPDDDGAEEFHKGRRRAEEYLRNVWPAFWKYEKRGKEK